ncbi:hypothetical protein [Kitasatospora mediocidica]|uniref:hypothetical protein n=1 Tax=Kitasatospora mediocidica TaxID=58352 RepID=UPI001E36675C|nr:hypothetical protein [Kitasatospora mediocidica]
MNASLVLLLGAVIVLLIRQSAMRVLDLLLCGTFGFLLANTVAAPAIRHTLAWLAATVGSIHP